MDTQLMPVGESPLAMEQNYDRMPIGMRIMLDEKLFGRVQMMADMMSKSKTTPEHLRGSVPACFDVVGRALTWGLYPPAVAQATFDAGAGKLGYEAKLVQAIMENSGLLEEPIDAEFKGDWSKVTGKSVNKQSKKDPNKWYRAAAYEDRDEEGLSVVVSAKVKGRPNRQSFELMMKQCQPRNSTLWATDPKTQTYYVAVRRFASVVCPSLVMGVPFEDNFEHVGPENAREINPTDRKPEPTVSAKETIVSDLDAFAGTQPKAAAQDDPAPAETAKPATATIEGEKAPTPTADAKSTPTYSVWIHPDETRSLDSIKAAWEAISGRMQSLISIGDPDGAQDVLSKNAALVGTMKRAHQDALERLLDGPSE